MEWVAAITASASGLPLASRWSRISVLLTEHCAHCLLTATVVCSCCLLKRQRLPFARRLRLTPPVRLRLDTLSQGVPVWPAFCPCAHRSESTLLSQRCIIPLLHRSAALLRLGLSLPVSISGSSTFLPHGIGPRAVSLTVCADSHRLSSRVLL